MEAALHCDDRTVCQPAEQKTARMTLDGGEGKAGNLLVWYRRIDGDLLGQAAEARAQNDSNLGCCCRALPHDRGGGLDSIEERRSSRHADPPAAV